MTFFIQIVVIRITIILMLGVKVVSSGKVRTDSANVPAVPEIAFHVSSLAQFNDVVQVESRQPLLSNSYLSLEITSNSNAVSNSSFFQQNCGNELLNVFVLAQSCEEIVTVLFQILTRFIINPIASRLENIMVLLTKLTAVPRNTLGPMKCLRIIESNFPVESLSSFHLSSSVYIAFSLSDFIEIWELYTLKTFKILTKKLTTVSSFDGLKDWWMDASNNQIIRRQDWEGMPVVALISVDAFTYDSTNNVNEEIQVHFDNGIPKIIHGLSAFLYWDFLFALNFTEQVELEDTGFFEDVYNVSNNMRFDIYLNHFGLDEEKATFGNMLLPTSFDSIKAYFIQPTSHGVPSTFPFLMPGILFVLKGIMILVISGSFFKIIFNLIENHVIQKKISPNHDAIWWSFAVACQKSLNPGGYGFSSTVRMFILSIFVFSYFLNNSYTATIVSELKERSIPIKSLHALMESSGVIYLEKLSDISYTLFEAIEKTNSDWAKKVVFLEADYALSDLIENKGRTCFITWPEYFLLSGRKVLSQRSYSENAVERMICRTFSSFIYEPFYMQTSLSVHKQSPFATTFNYRILIGLERGLIKGRYHKIYSRKTSFPWPCGGHTSVQSDIVIQMQDVYCEFYCISAGIVVSLAVLIVEKVFVWCHMES